MGGTSALSGTSMEEKSSLVHRLTGSNTGLRPCFFVSKRRTAMQSATREAQEERKRHARLLSPFPHFRYNSVFHLLLFLKYPLLPPFSSYNVLHFGTDFFPFPSSCLANAFSCVPKEIVAKLPRGTKTIVYLKRMEKRGEKGGGTERLAC